MGAAGSSSALLSGCYRHLVPLFPLGAALLATNVTGEASTSGATLELSAGGVFFAALVLGHPSCQVLLLP